MALGQLLLGAENRWGKMPYTLYDEGYASTVNLTDTSFTNGNGRLYRHYRGQPVFSFGEGLSHTSFATRGCAILGDRHRDQQQAAADADEHRFHCVLANTGERAGDEVLQVYAAVSPPIRARLSHPVPTKRLVDFQRVRSAAGAVTNVTFTVPAKRLSIANEKGGYVLYAGVHLMSFATGALRNPVQRLNLTISD